MIGHSKTLQLPVQGKDWGVWPRPLTSFKWREARWSRVSRWSLSLGLFFFTGVSFKWG